MFEKNVFDGKLKTEQLIMRNLKEEALLAQTEIDQITNDLNTAMDKQKQLKDSDLKDYLYTLKRISYNLRSDLETYCVHFCKLGGIKSIMIMIEQCLLP